MNEKKNIYFFYEKKSVLFLFFFLFKIKMKSKKTNKNHTSNNQEMDLYWITNSEEIKNIIEKKEIFEKKYSTFNIKSLETYWSFFIYIIVLSILSWLFRWTSISKTFGMAILIISFIIITFLLVFFEIIRKKSANQKKKEKKITIKAEIGAYIWFFWCLYSLLTDSIIIQNSLNFHFIFHILHYICLIFAYIIVLLTYTTKVLQSHIQTTTCLLLIFLTFVLIPHNDSISFYLQPLMFFGKFLAFSIIYCATEIELELVFAINSTLMFLKENNKQQHNNTNSALEIFLFNQKKTELLIIRTMWILYFPSSLFFLVFFQLILVYSQYGFIRHLYEIYISALSSSKKKSKNRILIKKQDDEEQDNINDDDNDEDDEKINNKTNQKNHEKTNKKPLKKKKSEDEEDENEEILKHTTTTNNKIIPSRNQNKSNSDLSSSSSSTKIEIEKKPEKKEKKKIPSKIIKLTEEERNKLAKKLDNI